MALGKTIAMLWNLLHTMLPVSSASTLNLDVKGLLSPPISAEVFY